VGILLVQASLDGVDFTRATDMCSFELWQNWHLRQRSTEWNTDGDFDSHEAWRRYKDREPARLPMYTGHNKQVSMKIQAQSEDANVGSKIKRGRAIGLSFNQSGFSQSGAPAFMPGAVPTTEAKRPASMPGRSRSRPVHAHRQVGLGLRPATTDGAKQRGAAGKEDEQEFTAELDPVITEFRASNRSLRQHISHLLTYGTRKQRDVWVDFFRAMFDSQGGGEFANTARLTYKELCLEQLLPAFGIQNEELLLEVWVAVDRLDRGYVSFQHFKELLTTFRPPDKLPGPSEYSPALSLVQSQSVRQPFCREETALNKRPPLPAGNTLTLCYDPSDKFPSTLQVGRARTLHDTTRPHTAEFSFGGNAQMSASSASATGFRKMRFSNNSRRGKGSTT